MANSLVIIKTYLNWGLSFFFKKTKRGFHIPGKRRCYSMAPQDSEGVNNRIKAKYTNIIFI